jgi:hypothetical protein
MTYTLYVFGALVCFALLFPDKRQMEFGLLTHRRISAIRCPMMTAELAESKKKMTSRRSEKTHVQNTRFLHAHTCVFRHGISHCQRQQRVELHMDIEDWDQISKERVSAGLHDYFKCVDSCEVLR